MKKSRIEERDELLTSLGLLIDPIRRLVFGGDDPGVLIPYIRSQFHQDLNGPNGFREHAATYCSPGKHDFGTELDVILRETGRFTDFLGEIENPSRREGANERFQEQVKKVQKALRSVPCEDVGVVLPSESPLQTYYRIRATCSAATFRIDLFDPYLDADVFHRYLRDVGDQTYLRVVTSEKAMSQKQDSSTRPAEILAVSNLVSLERPNSYGFYVASRLHDRHLRVDDKIFHLGGSINNASHRTPYTISVLEPNQTNHDMLDGLISDANEWFGSRVRKHRRS